VRPRRPQAGSSWLVNFRSTSRPEASLAAIVAILGKEDCDEIERPRPRSAERGIYGQLNGKYAVCWRPQAYAITVAVWQRVAHGFQPPRPACHG
jgi:hypothetical protein